MQGLKPTLFHTLELIVVFGVAFGIVKLFNVDSNTYQVLIGLVIASLTKFARASELPVPDYVNE